MRNNPHVARDVTCNKDQQRSHSNNKTQAQTQVVVDAVDAGGKRVVPAPFAILLRPREGHEKQGAVRRDVAQQLFQSCMQCERLTAEHNAKKRTCTHTFVFVFQHTCAVSSNELLLAPQHLDVLLAAPVVSATTGVSDGVRGVVRKGLGKWYLATCPRRCSLVRIAANSGSSSLSPDQARAAGRLQRNRGRPEAHHGHVHAWRRGSCC